ncbi:MAG: hypothetical protein [Myoviridae sp. ctThM1]|nr:MAG: hypothetical protein [Myoviridae sp. ctThM1]
MAFKFHRRARFSYWSTSIENMFNKENKPLISFESVDDMLSHISAKDALWVRIVDGLQDAVMFPADLYNSIRIYSKNSRGNTHVLDGGLEKGQWYDLDYRTSRCLFNELDKFITQEKGLETHKWEMEAVMNEDWGISPDSPYYGTKPKQSLDAIEQNEIWEWWKENKDKEFVDLDEEAAYIEKETEMLIRLIKIRNSLWT